MIERISSLQQTSEDMFPELNNLGAQDVHAGRVNTIPLDQCDSERIESRLELPATFGLTVSTAFVSGESHGLPRTTTSKQRRQRSSARQAEDEIENDKSSATRAGRPVSM